MSRNIVLITGRDNFVWTSMQEIIPMIEATWISLCKKCGYNLQIINVDTHSPQQVLKSLIESDLLVVTCFNTKISRFIKITREKLNIDTRIFFYLHGLATIALWPLERFEILNLMTNQDLFIGTCAGDIKSLNLSFTNALSKKVPFTIIDPVNIEDKNSIERPFVFIGRISPQKNLDQLIRAYSKLSENIKEKHPLIFYGSEDNLGFPNLGLKDTHYLESLKALVQELNIDSHVKFKGFVERLKIQKELGTHYIFVSPSTHSDENFGMAAFRSLLTGVPCVLSSWGGHIEFKKFYSSQISYIEPILTKSGPVFSLIDFQGALLKAIDSSVTKPHIHLNLENIIESLNDEINKTSALKEKINPTLSALKIYGQQKEFEKQSQEQRCFHSFKDPLFIEFFKAYLE